MKTFFEELNNLKIGTQIRIGIVISLTLITVLGVVSWLKAERIAQRTTEIYNHPYKVGTTVGELSVDIMTMREGMRNVISSRQKAHANAVQEQMEVKKSHAIKMFDVLYLRYLGKREDLDEAYNSFVKWNVTRERILRDKGVQEEDLQLENAQAELLLQKIQQIYDFSKRKAQSFYDEFVVESKSLKGQLVYWFLGIMLFISLMLYYVVKGIRLPLKELESVTQLF